MLTVAGGHIEALQQVVLRGFHGSVFHGRVCRWDNLLLHRACSAAIARGLAAEAAGKARSDATGAS